jgi:HEAT repeat protein
VVYGGRWRRQLTIGVECLICVTISILLSLHLMDSIMGFSDQTPRHPTPEEAIKKLWSEDASVRDLGRAELLRMGPAAVEPLGSLLWDLVHDHRPRFAIERENEGRKALDESLAVLRSKDPPFDHEAFDEAFRLAINARLISDAISLLGELRVVEGVPILVRIMERRKWMGWSEPAGLELDALSKIGSPAVPSLIKSIENARVNAIAALSEQPIGFHVCLLADSEDDLEDGEDDEWDPVRDGSALDPELERIVEVNRERIVERALRVLARIGDESALPFLEALTETDGYEALGPSIREAIGAIRNEPGLGPRPVSRRR